MKRCPEKSTEMAIRFAQSFYNLFALYTEDGYSISVLQIMNCLGLPVRITDFKENKLKGCILVNKLIQEKYNNSRIILVSNNISEKEQRMIIAHLFSHYIFDYDPKKGTDYYNFFTCIEEKKNDEEIINRFASEFMLPEKKFLQVCSILQDETYYKRTWELSDLFNVPIEIIEKRYQELGLSK